MTFAEYLRTHPDPTIQKAAELLYGGEGGPIDLAEAVVQLDIAGAPSVAFQAIAEAWREWRKKAAAGKISGI